ncbi:hypothetical protein [Bacteroides sp.]
MGTIIVIIVAIVIAITIFMLIRAAIKANKTNREIDLVSPPDNDSESYNEQKTRK